MESQNIKLFQCVKKSCGTMGINLSHTNQNCSLNSRIILCFVPLIIFLISSSAYMIIVANSMLEFSDSFYINITAFSNIFTISITIWKMPIILNVISKLEKIIEKSKTNKIVLDVYKNYKKKIFFFPKNCRIE